jgi:hypothetical protein
MSLSSSRKTAGEYTSTTPVNQIGIP